MVPEKRTDTGISSTGGGDAQPGDEYNSELPPHTIDNLAAALPAGLAAAPLASPALGSTGPAGGGDAGRPATHTIEINTGPGIRVPAGDRVTRNDRADRGERLGAAAAGAVQSLSGPAQTGPADAGAQSRRERLRPDGGTVPESAAMLTSERLLAVNRRTQPPPHGGWNAFVYAATLHLVNLGDSAKVRAHKDMDALIRKEFDGGTRFVPILTRKGGVGKTTVTALLGMALADAREDRIIAVDANPDRGTLSERVSKQTRSTVRDVVTKAASIGGFTDFSTLVSRDATRLDILASDTDPLLSEAFDEDDYNVVADLAARYYSIMLTDCGTGIVHSVMRATLQRADSIVVVSGGSVDEARLASETLTWLDANGYGDLVRNSIVALNTATQGTNLVKLEEIESHFRSRVREIVRIPYDPQLAAGSVISWEDLKPITRLAARTLAALVVEGLPAHRGA